MYTVEVSCDDQRTWSPVYGPVTECEAIEKMRDIEDHRSAGIDVRIISA